MADSYTSPIEPGCLVAGQYRLEKVVGRGGMGEVWRAWDHKLADRVAAKRVAPAEPGPGAPDRHALLRAEREAQALTVLQANPNIVTIYDVIDEVAQFWIIMEYLPGPSLQMELGRGRTFSVAQTAHIADEILGALIDVHAERMTHRDIKPHNIVLTADGRAVLIDFGIARHIDETRLTRGAVIGTLRYMAPEVMKGEDATPASDIYSLGATLVDLLGGAGAATVGARGGDVSQLGLAGRLESLTGRMLDGNPAHRPTALAAQKMLRGPELGPQDWRQPPNRRPGRERDEDRRPDSSAVFEYDVRVAGLSGKVSRPLAVMVLLWVIAGVFHFPPGWSALAVVGTVAAVCLGFKSFQAWRDDRLTIGPDGIRRTGPPGVRSAWNQLNMAYVAREHVVLDPVEPGVFASLAGRRVTPMLTENGRRILLCRLDETPGVDPGTIARALALFAPDPTEIQPMRSVVPPEPIPRQGARHPAEPFPEEEISADGQFPDAGFSDEPSQDERFQDAPSQGRGSPDEWFPDLRPQVRRLQDENRFDWPDD